MLSHPHDHAAVLRFLRVKRIVSDVSSAQILVRSILEGHQKTLHLIRKKLCSKISAREKREHLLGQTESGEGSSGDMNHRKYSEIENVRAGWRWDWHGTQILHHLTGRYN